MTRKFFVALMALAVLFTASLASAEYKDEIMEGADLTTVKKLAVAMPEFYKIESTEPEIHDWIKDIYDAGKRSSTLEIISYEDVAAAIRRDTGIDITVLERLEAEKVYKKNIARYADAYVVNTVIDSDKVPQMFFRVFNAADSNLMYTYNIRSRLYSKTPMSYSKMAEEFFIRFDSATWHTLDGEEQKKLRKKQQEIREKKRKADKLEAKTKKNKVDMVKKK